MDKLEQWVITICIICIITGVLSFLIPDGKIRKSLNIAYSLLLLTSVASIFTSADKLDIELNYNNYTVLSYNNNFDSYITDMADEETEKLICSELDLICIADYSVETEWENTDNTYELTQVRVVITQTDKDKIDDIKSAVGKLTGVIPEVQYTDAD